MKELTIGQHGSHEGTAKVVIKTGNIVEEEVDVICMTVGSTLEHSGAVWTALTSAGGSKAYKTAYEKARKKLTKWLDRGDILVVDTSNTRLGAKYVFLVVHPDIYHLEVAYRKLFQEAIVRGCTSIAIPGLGCGLIGNSAHASCMKACEVLYQVANDSLGTIQLIVFVDMKEDVAEQFSIHLQAKFGTSINGRGIDHLGSSFETFTKAPAKVHEDDCVICLCSLIDPSEVRELPCKHQFHIYCLKEYLRSPNARKRCPVCLRYFELPMGDQPVDALMLIEKATHVKLPGYEDSDFFYEITYIVPSGIQEGSHIRPGKPYTGTRRRAYVPGTPEGAKVLRLLKFAFDRRLIFTVGDSITTGAKNTVVWNNVHHKTNIAGGPLNVSLLSRDGTLEIAASVIWFFSAILYFWGLYVTSRALTYVTNHYRGYDDVDPDRVQFIEQMLRDLIDEIKQKELDVAAGAGVGMLVERVIRSPMIAAKREGEGWVLYHFYLS